MLSCVPVLCSQREERAERAEREREREREERERGEREKTQRQPTSNLADLNVREGHLKGEWGEEVWSLAVEVFSHGILSVSPSELPRPHHHLMRGSPSLWLL